MVVVVVVVAWVCLYFKVSYPYYLTYDCLKLGISHLAACSELNGSCVLLHQSHYSTCCECERSLAFYGSIISALKNNNYEKQLRSMIRALL